MGRSLAMALTTAWLAVTSGAAAGDTVEAFYKGRQVNLIVGYGPGGGNDVYARLLARYVPKYLPGHPTIIIQNMPGAGSIVATNYLYNVAPRDGATFGNFARTIALLGLMPNSKAKYDPRRFTWLGTSSSFANDAYALMVRKDAKVKTLDGARNMDGPPILLGSTADGASSDAAPTVLRELVGLNVKAISGYRDSSELFLAIERGEVDGRTAGLSAIRSTKPEWLKPDGMMRLLVVLGRPTRHPDYPDVPTAREIAKGPQERALIEVIDIPYQMSKPFAAPPDVPADRAAALRAAFLAAHKDADYLADAKKLDIDVSPIGADEIMALIEKTSRLSPDLLQSVEKMIE